ncbi:iron-containing redox enzyme family protein [Micromonospora tarensis]|uniref:Iron-containing redox enzyme family protein n=1 Tax=Micromonospora tarensis TaxID=2806100 RepID=A0ABS1YDR1_9ACTN|nr:iron-containing redox enzyme family protein [Micromonospora tarensis]MBM0275492.1 iron-containing redox enzyme family protein [Micromonospora tarensis]
METGEARARVESALKAVREHPFIVEAAAGTLTREQAIRWVCCAGRESRSFPWILRMLLTWIDNERVREILQDNLDDELGNGDPDDAHFMHYVHLLDNLGVPRAEFDSYQESTGIRHALNLAFNMAACRRSGWAIGYMLVNEAMTPITYEAARGALLPKFPHLVTNFFDLHVEVDEHHVAALYEAVAELPAEESAALAFGISVGQRGMELLLDEAYGVLDYHTEKIDIVADRWNPASAVA